MPRIVQRGARNNLLTPYSCGRPFVKASPIAVERSVERFFDRGFFGETTERWALRNVTLLERFWFWNRDEEDTIYDYDRGTHCEELVWGWWICLNLGISSVNSSQFFFFFIGILFSFLGQRDWFDDYLLMQRVFLNYLKLMSVDAGTLISCTRRFGHMAHFIKHCSWWK